MPGQIALLKTGEIVVADPNYNRISIISDETVNVLTDENNINGWSVCTLPDGRICYSLLNGQIILINPNNGVKSNFGFIPDGARVEALATDEFGNIYAATSHLELFRFGLDGVPVKLVDNLPYDVDWAIFDLEVDRNGIIYVAGFNRVVRITPEGSVEIIAGNLNYEPVWVEVAIDGSVYINDAASGLQRYNDTNGQLEDFRPYGFSPFGGILSPANNEIIFHETQAFYKYNLTTDIATSLLVVPGNSHAFAANANNIGFLFNSWQTAILEL